MPHSEKITFTGVSGHELDGRLDLPVDSPRAVALLAHCFTCGKDSLATSRIARALTEHGIATFRFDFTGIGQSAGEFANTTFSSNVADLVRAAEHLRSTLEAPSLLVGHSLGGAAVLAAAERIPESRAVVTIGAPADPAHVTGLFTEHVPEIEDAGEAPVTLAGREFCVSREFLADVQQQPQIERITRLDRALLVLHAPHDELVSVDNAREIFDSARHPKSFVSLDNADHLLTDKQEADYAANVIAAWADRYLDEKQIGVDDAADEPGTVIVSETGEGPFAQRIQVGPHTLTADEPVSAGGHDLGPTPYGYLLSALGSCTSMTMRMYADRKQWPLQSVTVTLQHSRIYAEDCESCETKKGLLDHIQREITIEGDLDEEQRARLMDIADKCPVHRTLRSEVVIHTTSDT